MKHRTRLLARIVIVVLALTAIHDLAQSAYTPYTFITLAGNAGYGSTDGTGSEARFYGPSGVAVDNTGNVYVADKGNNTIRKMTPAGIVTTLAGLAGDVGSADGTGSGARFWGPSGVAVDSAGNVYVADTGNHTIRKVTTAGVVTTLAGLPGSAGSIDATGSNSRLNQPFGVAVDSSGNVFVADTGNHTIRQVTPTGVVTTLAGLAGNPGSADGMKSDARFYGPSSVAVDSAGNVYVAETGNYTIRKITAAGVVTTMAGVAGSSGEVDGTGSDARFHYPGGVAVDPAGNVYVADEFNDTIRKMSPEGEVTTLAGRALIPGSADGTGSTARFNGPSGVAVDNAGNVYVAESYNHTIRKVTPAGEVTTMAGRARDPDNANRSESIARFRYPAGVAVDSMGNVFVADWGNDTIRKVTPAGGVTTLAGLAGYGGSADGTGAGAQFDGPSGVAVDSGGNVYVAEQVNHTIRKVTPAGVVTTLAGLPGSVGSTDGTGNTARFNHPLGLAVDRTGNLYVADSGNNTIRKVTPAGVVTTLAGNASITNQFGDPIGGYADGTGSDARFSGPFGVAVDSADNVYVADYANDTIRKVTPTGVVTTLAGSARQKGGADGTGNEARFFYPSGIAADSAGNIYVADYQYDTIRRVTPAGVVTTVAGSYGSADGTGSAAQFNQPWGVAVDSASNVYVADSSNNTIRKMTPAGVVTTLAGLAGNSGSNDGTGAAGPDGTGSNARFHYPFGVAVDNSSNVYVADTDDDTIRKVTPAGVVTTLAGLAGSSGDADGTGSTTRFNGPSGVAVDIAGNVYVADTVNSTIRKVTPAGVVTTLAGLAGSSGRADGRGSDARFNGPSGVAVDSVGNVYVVDPYNHTIRKVTSAGAVTTLAGLAITPGSADGTGSDAQFNYPSGVAVDSAGNLYVADSGNNTIRKVTPAGVVTTLAGLALTPGSEDGTGNAARFNYPSGLAVDSAGNLYVAEIGNNTIRKVTPAGVVTTLAGLAGSYGNADGTGSDARFRYPGGVAVDGAGSVYVTDTYNNTIRKGYPALAITSSGPNLDFSGGQFGFNLTGPAGQLVILEASTDLVNWLPIWTNTFARALHFSDSQSGIYSSRFYRAHTP